MPEHEYEYEDGDGVAWTILAEIEPRNAGGWEEPPSGGVAAVCEIRHADGSRLPDDSWGAAGFSRAALERIEDRIYDQWACGSDDPPCRCKGKDCKC